MLCLGYSKLIFKHTLRLVAFTVLPITNIKNEKHWTIIQSRKREEQAYGGQEDFRSAVSKQCFYSPVTKAGTDCRVQRQDSRESTCQQVPLHYIFLYPAQNGKNKHTSSNTQGYFNMYAKIPKPLCHTSQCFPLSRRKKKRGSLTLT